MNLMICSNGDSKLFPYLPEITDLGAGIELGSYGLIGIRSTADWETRLRLHRAVRAQFQGDLALHGPFIGMEFAHIDHLIRAVVNQRLDMLFEAAVALRAGRVVLHSGFRPETELFRQQETWLKKNVEFWRGEIQRWSEAGITIVLENDLDRVPDHLIRLVESVNHPALGLCLDVGHLNVFSHLDAAEWVRRMGHWLYHVHLHDNDGQEDRHWAMGRGQISFEPFYRAVNEHAPHAVFSLEVEEEMGVKMQNLRELASRFAN